MRSGLARVDETHAEVRVHAALQHHSLQLAYHQVRRQEDFAALDEMSGTGCAVPVGKAAVDVQENPAVIAGADAAGNGDDLDGTGLFYRVAVSVAGLGARQFHRVEEAGVPQRADAAYYDAVVYAEFFAGGLYAAQQILPGESRTATALPKLPQASSVISRASMYFQNRKIPVVAMYKTI